MVILGLERLSQFHEIVSAHESGRAAADGDVGRVSHAFDPSQAPAGKHTAFMWEKVPYAASFDAGQHGRDLLDLWTTYAPNLKGSRSEWFVRTPRDTEIRLPNMRYGDLLVGSFCNGQIGYNRPFPSAAVIERR